MATMRQYRNRWSALSNRLSFFFSLFFLILLLPNFFVVVLFYFISSSFDLIVIWKVIGFNVARYICIHEDIYVYMYDLRRLHFVMWFYGLVNRFKLGWEMYIFICIVITFKWSNKKIISKIDDSGIVEYCWKCIWMDILNGFVNTSEVWGKYNWKVGNKIPIKL